MGFWSDLGKGISTHVRGIEFIAKHRLWHFFLYPLIILILLFLGGYWSVLQLADWIVDSVLSYYGWTDAMNTDDWTGWLAIIGKFIVGLILKVLFLMILTSYIKYIVLIICSPILALLSERIDEIISQKKYPFNAGQFLRDILRGILVTLRNMALETCIILGCLLIGFLPVIGWITVPFLYVVAWYFLGFAMMDYSYERMRMKIGEGVHFTRKHKGIAIGNGFIFSMILLLPFIGVIIAPVLSVVAATLAVLEVKQEEALQAQHLPPQGRFGQ
jgi:CysZ protein